MSNLDRLETKYPWLEHSNKNQTFHLNSKPAVSEEEMFNFCKDFIAEYSKTHEVGSVSDGYHTFDDYFEARKMYNAVLFNEWASQGLYDVHKSKYHYGGDECFGGGWFIVVAMLPTGQISNHYKLEDWNLFQCPTVDKAKYEFDGHTSVDVLARLRDLTYETDLRPCQVTPFTTKLDQFPVTRQYILFWSNNSTRKEPVRGYIEFGLSTKQREALPNEDMRKHRYGRADKDGDFGLAYCWVDDNCRIYSPEEVQQWIPCPERRKETAKEFVGRGLTKIVNILDEVLEEAIKEDIDESK